MEQNNKSQSSAKNSPPEVRTLKGVRPASHIVVVVVRDAITPSRRDVDRREQTHTYVNEVDEFVKHIHEHLAFSGDRFVRSQRGQSFNSKYAATQSSAVCT